MVVLVSFSLVVLKLFFIQVISFERYSAAAESQHFYSLDIPARRGEILSRDGFALVGDRNDYLFYGELPKLTDNKSLVAEKLASILVLDVPHISTDGAVFSQQDRENFIKTTQEELRKKLETKLNSSAAVWVNLAHFVSPETKEKIENLKISGLGFLEEQSRDYPEASMAAHLLGFVGFDLVGNPKGYFGLEGNYDQELSGRAGQLRMEKDAFGRPIAIGTETRKEKQDGRNLLTTIDRSVQKFTEKSLEDGIMTWKASGGSAIVMNPKNGEILAMASLPRYDLRNFSYYPSKTYKNPAIADLYEPGSIMKPLVVAAAINENKITPETRCNKCDGPRQIGEYSIHTFNNQYNPNLTATEILINSDNTGMVFVGEKIGFPKLYSYVQKYGFGQKSGIDLQEEEEGSLRKSGEYTQIDEATLTFGQGVAVNAVQMMKAWSVLANNGVMVTPHLVTSVNSTDRKINLDNYPTKKVLTPATAKALTEMLVRVARESPVHFPLDREKGLSNFKIAAKSGTAEIAIGGKYLKQGTIASVIGYFPADDPKFLVMVKLNEPEVRPWGSDTAGPVFASIARDLLYYYGINP